jgi:hypothetical protein
MKRANANGTKIRNVPRAATLNLVKPTIPPAVEIRNPTRRPEEVLRKLAWPSRKDVSGITQARKNE